MSRDQTIALAAGCLSGVLSLTLVTGLMGLVAYFAPLPLFVVGLGMGLSRLLVAAGAACVASALAAAALFGAGHVLYGVGFALLVAAPVYVLSRFALLNRTGIDGTVEWYPAGRLAVVAATLAALLFLLAALLTAGEPGGLQGEIETQLREMLSLIAQPGQEASVDAVAEAWSRQFAAFVACSWVLQMALNGALAQAIVRRLGWAQRPTPGVMSFDVPDKAMILFAVLLAGAILAPGTLGFLALTLAAVFAMPFLFLGIAVVHAGAGRFKAKRAWLATFYILLVLTRWPVLLVTVLGFIERWARLRERALRAA